MTPATNAPPADVAPLCHGCVRRPLARAARVVYSHDVYSWCIVHGMVAQTFLGLLEAHPRHGYDLKRAYDLSLIHI